MQNPSTSPPGPPSPPFAARTSISLIYILLLACISIHLYRTPSYTNDSLQYMGNALLMEETDPVKLHRRVYAELDRGMPAPAREHMLGLENGVPAPHSASLRERALDPYRFAECLPWFAIRPLYNLALYLLSRTGLGLLRSSVFLSAASHFLLGVLLFRWLIRYLAPFSALGVAVLSMMSPPLMDLGRQNTSDALASLIAFSALYLIFEKQRLLPGMVLLLASLYFRTDFVVLAGPALLALWLTRKITFWQAGLLSGLALASVFAINHFGGDYGIQMLYYRNFVDAPTAPAEIVVHFSFHEYLAALRHGFTLVSGSFFLPFLLLGTVGTVLRSRLLAVAAIATTYAVLHFVVLPNWDERWFGVFYLAMVLCAASAGRRDAGDSHPLQGKIFVSL